MKALYTLALAAAMALPALVPAAAQGRKSLRINEVMVVNDSSVVDDYGRHVAWVEICNPTAAAVNVASIFFTDDLGDMTKSRVPSGDARTRIAKGQQLLFWADGSPAVGPTHIAIELKPGRDNFIAIIDADGKTLIDSVTIPASLQADCSYARATDGGATWEVRDNATPESAVTPGAANTFKGPNHNITNFKEMDENGTAMTMMAMAIVFGALLVLCLCFYMISRISTAAKKAKAAAPAAPQQPAAKPASGGDADEEVAAAIALALHRHLNMHDNLNMALTIVHNPASAWNSKTMAMRRLPRR